MDVFAPLDVLQLVAFNYSVKTYMIAETMEPVSNRWTAKGPAEQKIVITHTFGQCFDQPSHYPANT